VTSELADLEHYLDVANKANFHGLPGKTKAEDLLAVSRIRNKLDALDVAVITAFEATKEHAVEGHASCIGWLQHHSRDHGDPAALRRRLARRIRHLPLAHEALLAGEITARHVDVLDRARTVVGDDAFAIGEHALVDAAVVKRFSDFARLVEYFVQEVGPRDADQREQQRDEDRYGSSSRTLDGDGKIDAWMPALAFTVWQDELERLLEAEYRKDVAEATDRLGRRPLPSELARTTRQRRVDAMEQMAKRSAAYTGADLGPSNFTLIVHGDAELVARLLAVVVDEDATIEDLEDLEIPAGSIHELDDGTVVTVNTVILALLAGTVRGILYDPYGEILRYGPARRLFTPAQAQALRAKYRRCAHPYGCDRTGARLQTDHIVEHQHGGPTDTANGQPLCGTHNRWKTNHQNDPTTAPIDRDQRRTQPRTGP
jgi:HNH endonuclease